MAASTVVIAGLPVLIRRDRLNIVAATKAGEAR
jgi:hypothetical protein